MSAYLVKGLCDLLILSVHKVYICIFIKIIIKSQEGVGKEKKAAHFVRNERLSCCLPMHQEGCASSIPVSAKGLRRRVAFADGLTVSSTSLFQSRFSRASLGEEFFPQA